MESDAHLVDDSFNRGPVAWLTEWNFPGAMPPRVRRIMDDPAELKALAERDKTIVDMGHKLTREYVEETYQVEVDRTAPKPPPPALPGLPVQGDPGVELAEDEEDSVAVLREQARRAIGPLVDGGSMQCALA